MVFGSCLHCFKQDVKDVWFKNDFFFNESSRYWTSWFFKHELGVKLNPFSFLLQHELVFRSRGAFSSSLWQARRFWNYDAKTRGWTKTDWHPQILEELTCSDGRVGDTIDNLPWVMVRWFHLLFPRRWKGTDLDWSHCSWWEFFTWVKWCKNFEIKSHNIIQSLVFRDIMNPY